METDTQIWKNILDSTNPRSGGQVPTNTPTLGTDVPGDADGNGKVDVLDYAIWLNHYSQSTGNGSSDGDFNESGNIDGLDYVIWLNNYSP